MSRKKQATQREMVKHIAYRFYGVPTEDDAILEAKTFGCRRCNYCYCIIAILAFYCRRLERMAQCKLIFFVSSCGSVWINNVSSQKIKDS